MFELTSSNFNGRTATVQLLAVNPILVPRQIDDSDGLQTAV